MAICKTGTQSNLFPNPFKNLEIISLVLLRLISSVLNVLEAFWYTVISHNVRLEKSHHAHFVFM